MSQNNQNLIIEFINCKKTKLIIPNEKVINYPRNDAGVIAYHSGYKYSTGSK